jgi:hypothetical protein
VEKNMHDLLIALAFIGMVVAPAIVAAKTVSEAPDGYRHDFDPPDTAIVSAKSGAEATGN